MEIERQFLVNALPLLPNEYDTIRQGYVALLPEIRIRQVGDSRFTLTVKRRAGLVREEWESEISRQEFDSLAERLLPGTRMIEKCRYRLPLAGGQTAEIHIHGGHLAGFSYVEVEFKKLRMPFPLSLQLGLGVRSRRIPGSPTVHWRGRTA